MDKKAKISVAYRTVLVERYAPLLPAKQRKYVEQKYFMDLSLAEIAERNKVSRAAVQDALRRSMQFLQGAESALQLIYREKKISELLKKITDKKLASKISELL